jgi:hypothetical protein
VFPEMKMRPKVTGLAGGRSKVETFEMFWNSSKFQESARSGGGVKVTLGSSTVKDLDHQFRVQTGGAHTGGEHIPFVGSMHKGPKIVGSR